MTPRVPALVLVAMVLFALPALGGGPMCMIYGPPYAKATPAASVYVGVTFLTGGGNPTAAMCGMFMTSGGIAACASLVTPVGAYNCPTTAAAPGCRGVLAKLPLTKIPGTFKCSFTCDCGAGAETFVMDNAAGLPVELMGFAVEPESERAGKSDAQPGAEKD